MNVHEYQAKEMLREFGVPVPAGVLATTPAEAEDAARELGTAVVVVKAQVHAGGARQGRRCEVGEIAERGEARGQ